MKISVGTDGGCHSRVCAHLTLRSALHRGVKKIVGKSDQFSRHSKHFYFFLTKKIETRGQGVVQILFTQNLIFTVS